MKRIVLLGATGSIGRQTLDVLSKHPDEFSLVGICAGHNAKELKKIAEAFPSVEAIGLFENKEEIESQIDSYNKTTSPQFRIRHLWFREEKLPRTSTGKLKRYQLADEFKNWLLSEEKQ